MIRRMVKSASVLMFLVGASAAFAVPRTIYVPGDFGTIQEAIDDCNDGDTVIVAEGTYTGAGNKNLDFLGKAIALLSTCPDDPAVVANTVIDCQNSGRAFKFHSGEDANSIVSGFTITGGSTYQNGGGIYCTGASPSILYCVVTNNYAENCGGGIYCTSNSNPVIINCTVSGNTAQGPDGFDFGVPGSPGYGGGIYGSPDSHLTIQDCTITGNTASGGVEGLAIVPPAPTDGNAYGGGIYGNATIDDCIISDNTAAGGYSEGGTSRAFGGGIYGVVQITRSKITGNTSVAEGGQIAFFPFLGYFCACGGGVFALGDSSATNCLIAQNQAHKYPQSISFWDNNLGGGLCADPQSEVDIRNCTIVANTASGGYFEVEGLGGGIYSNSTTTVANSILWANAADSGPQIYGPGPVSYSDVQGGRTGEGNINADPLFTNPAGDDYHLESGSPCINVGDNNAVPPSVVTDLDGNPRIIDGTVDMGAYESPVTMYELTVIVTGGYGVVEPNSGFYPPGTVVTLTATPSEGYRLAQWSGTDDDISLCLTNTVTMNGDKFVTVELEESYPRVIVVGSGPEYTTIQDAIDDAREGDTVVVQTGTHTGNIRFRGANITLTSMVPDDPCVVAATIIEGTAGDRPAVTFTGCEDETCALDGLTIADGNAIGDGGGISGNGTQATIANCVIRNNRANGYGGGISDCNGRLRNCTISSNIAGSGGGLSNYSGQLVNCIINNNSADDGDGGGIYCSPHTSLLIINSTITGNSAWFKGGGIFCGPNSLPTITNCILWENDAEFGRQIYTFGGFPVVTYSDVQGGHAGQGNIDADPQFVDPNSGDYHLGAGSPCIDIGDNNAVPPSVATDMDGNPRIINGVVDLGPYETIFFYVDGINGNDGNNGRSPETAFATIQKGINSAQDGCVVLVYPAVYLNPDPEVWEEIDFLGKNIKLTSADPPDWSTVANTVIAGSVSFSGSEDPNCTLTGFTIRHLANGAIYGNHTHATISHCILSGNAPCGAIVVEYCDGTISNCLITDNSTIFLCGAYPVVFGCHGLIRNCTIANNATNIGVLNGGTTTIQNCIIYANGDPDDPNTSQIGIADGGTLNISYSNVEGGLTGIYNDGDVNWGPGNIDTDPCFVRLGYWDWGAWPCELFEGDYHLMSEAWRWDANVGRWTYDYVTSRSIDAGNPGSPLGGELMSVPADPNNEWGTNLRTNMGAYGGTAEASMAPHGWALLADLNNDGITNRLDLKALVEDWLRSESGLPADLSRDGLVNGIDFSLMAGEWEQTANWLQFADLRQYWPFGIGHQWDSEAVPDAGYLLRITNRFFVNGFEIWEFTNWYGAIWGGAEVTSYYVYVDGILYATENLSDLDRLPDIAPTMRAEYLQFIPIGVPVHFPFLGLGTVRQGPLNSVLGGTGFSVEDFPLGDRPDVICFISQGGEHVIVFARDLGPMRLDAYSDFGPEELFIVSTTLEDITPPGPAPSILSMEFSPPNSVTMTASDAYDVSGVEYYFKCISGGGNDSGWQDETLHTDVNLAPDTLYCYRVKARDKSPNHNETGWSNAHCIILFQDPDPPTPDPMQWDETLDANGFTGIPHEVLRAPYGDFDYWAVMRADPNTTDASGSWEFYFECVTRSDFSSVWMSFPAGPPYEYAVKVGMSHQEQVFRVRARDPSGNMTAWSTAEWTRW